MKTQLAILIPAYKVDFLEEVFECICNQTCKDFNLYVFDDCSPYDVKSVYERYFAASSNSKYIRFDKNLGGTNLVKHWNRCLELIVDEEWVWLFSDDDRMDYNCVEKFYALKEKETIDVLHFQLSIIEFDGRLRKHTYPYPPCLSSSDFFVQLYTGRIDARMPEFILRRDKLIRLGGYKEFDLAWRSDNATVIEMGTPRGIMTIAESHVFWRSSKKNVSGTSDYNTLYRKQKATIDFLNWTHDFFISNNLCHGLSKIELMRICQAGILKGNKKMSFYGTLKAMKKIKYISTPIDYLLFISYTLFYLFKK